MPKKVSYKEAQEMIRNMTEAKDPWGNRLYDDTEIAQVFGCSSYSQLEEKLKEARKKLREALIKQATLMRKEDKTDEQIAEELELTVDTVKVLLDPDISRCIQDAMNVEKARKEYLDSIAKDMQQHAKELERVNRKLGWNYPLF